MQAGNLFRDATPPGDGERVDVLLSHRNLVIERIVSAADFATRGYVQSQDEWFVLLSGDALLQVGTERVSLKAGDYLFLPSGTPHTVECASHGALWLAVHLHPNT